MNRLISACSLVAFVLISNGCATITRGTKEIVTIQSTPGGAQVRVIHYSKEAKESLEKTGKADVSVMKSKWFEEGTTPATFKLARNRSYLVTVSSPGYRPVTVPVMKQVSPGGAAGVAGNVLIGGLVGLGVDAISGGANQLKPNPVEVNLQR